MESTIKLTDTQKKALELVQKLAEEKKIDLNEAVQLIIAIYENQKEFVYVPYQNPWIEPYRPWIDTPWVTQPTTIPYRDDTPWWEKNKIMCDENVNSVSSDPNKTPFTYMANGVNWGPYDWITNTLIG